MDIYLKNGPADGKTIAAEELGLIIHWGEQIKPGDLYLAGRNTGVKFLTCKSVHPRRWVSPTTDHYPYDCHECVKVTKRN